MSFLGSSPVTSILGYLIAVASVVQQVWTDQGMPHDVSGWLAMIGGIVTGVALRFAKDSNVSHSTVPTAPAKVN